MGTAKQKKLSAPKATKPQAPAPAEAQAAEDPQLQIVVPSGAAQEFALLDGRKVTMAKPSGVYSLLMYRLLGESSTNDVLSTIYRGIFHVTAINGEAIAPIQSAAEFEMVAAQLGDLGLDEVGSYYLAHFAPRPEVVRPLSKTQSP